MGLCMEANGLEQTYDYGYGTYCAATVEIARATHPKLGEIWEKALNHPYRNFTAEENAIWDELSNEGLDILLFHSGCDGEFSPEECGKVYEAIKDLNCDMVVCNYNSEEKYNVVDRFKDIFGYCAQNHVTLYYY